MKFNNLRIAVLSALAAVSTLPVISHAQATPPDLTTLTGSIDVSTVISGVLSVGATMIGVYLAVLGYKFIARMVQRG